MSDKKKIIIVEDEVNLAFTLVHTLKDFFPDQLDITVCHKGKEAAAYILRQSFDLVINDLRLPDVSGLALIIRAKKLHPQMRTILITAFGSDEVRAQAKLYTDAFLTKPFSPLEIVQLVQEMLDLEQAEEEPEIETADVEGLKLNEDEMAELNAQLEEAAAEAAAQRPTAAMTTTAQETLDEYIDLSPLEDVLENLRQNVQATSTAILDTSGHIMLKVGQSDEMDNPNFNVLLCNSMSASAEVARNLSDKSSFLLHYYGSETHEIYTCEIKADIFLALVINASVTVTRVGAAWIYLKKAILSIRQDHGELIDAVVRQSNEMVIQNFGLDDEFADTMADLWD